MYSIYIIISLFNIQKNNNFHAQNYNTIRKSVLISHPRTPKTQTIAQQTRKIWTRIISHQTRIIHETKITLIQKSRTACTFQFVTLAVWRVVRKAFRVRPTNLRYVREFLFLAEKASLFSRIQPATVCVFISYEFIRFCDDSARGLVKFRSLQRRVYLARGLRFAINFCSCVRSFVLCSWFGITNLTNNLFE